MMPDATFVPLRQRLSHLATLYRQDAIAWAVCEQTDFIRPIA